MFDQGDVPNTVASDRYQEVIDLHSCAVSLRTLWWCHVLGVFEIKSAATYILTSDK